MGKKILSFFLALILAVGMLPAAVFAEPAHVHDMVFMEGKEPTCTEEGALEHYHCTVCGKNFEEEQGEHELESVVIPATGHDWGKPSYHWAEDGTACTAERVCRKDSSHRETAEAAVEQEQTREPEIGVPGEITCTAVFDQADWAETQTKVIEGTLKDYFTLTYHSNGGTELPAELHPEGAEVPLDRAPVRIGHTFAGWYLDAELTKPVQTAEMTGNVEVYADWLLTPVPDALESETHPAYLAGYENSMIRPGNRITRAETATIFFRLLTLDNRLQNMTKSCDFRDVGATDWYRVQIAVMARMGILNGRGNHQFAPNAPITRAEFATICVRFAGEASIPALPAFTDTEGHWAEKDIRRAAAMGWIGGYEDGSFCPDSLISRAEAVTMVNRMLRRLPQKPEDLLPGMHTWADCHPEDWFYLAVQEATNGHSYERTEEASEKWTELKETALWSAAVNYRSIGCFALTENGTEPYVYAADFAYAMGLWVESDEPLVLGARDRISFAGGKIGINGTDTGARVEILYDMEGNALLPLLTTARALNCQVQEQNGRITVLEQVPKIEVKKGVNVPVLMYHAVSDDMWGIEELFVSPANMEKQLAYLVDNGYDPIWFEDLAHLEDYDKPVLLTFDDGYDDNYTELFPLLKKYQVKATIFVIGNAMGWSHKMTRAQVREMSDSGLVSIQSHGYTHDNMDMMDEATLEYELSESKKVLAEVTGRIPYVLCYPSGRYSNLTLKVAQEHYQFGIKMQGGLYNTSHNPFLVNRYYISRYTDIYTFAAFIAAAGT